MPKKKTPKRPVNKIAFGRRVAKRRNALGMSQPQLAEAAGMSQQNVNTIEHGITARPGQLRELARALQTTQQWLLWEEGPEQVELDAGENDVSPDSQLLNHCWSTAKSGP